MEVHRWGQADTSDTFGEGSAGYGCWFWPLLAPLDRGSGIFVNTGVTRVFANRREASKWCPGARPKPPGGDNLWAGCARKEGVDSLQILNGWAGQPELLVTRQGCLVQPHPIGACPPPDVELRTGFRAELACVCSEYTHGGLPAPRLTKAHRQGPLNCDGGVGPLPGVNINPEKPPPQPTQGSTKLPESRDSTSPR